MIKFLGVDEIISIHDHYIISFGGSLGIRDERLLDSAVFRARSSFGGKDLYPTIFEKAAVLFHGLIFNHPFVDGKKRVALMSAISLLVRNNFDFSITDQELVAFPLAVEKTRPQIPEIANWFKKHSKRRKG